MPTPPISKKSPPRVCSPIWQLLSRVLVAGLLLISAAASHAATSGHAAGMVTIAAAGDYLWAPAAGKLWRIDQKGSAVATNLSAYRIPDVVAYRNGFVGWIAGSGWIASSDGITWRPFKPPALVPAISVYAIFGDEHDIYAATNAGTFYSSDLTTWEKLALNRLLKYSTRMRCYCAQDLDFLPRLFAS